jgi:hypothetical protein
MSSHDRIDDDELLPFGGDQSLADLQAFLDAHPDDGVNLCLGGADEWLELNDARVTKSLAQLVRKCTQLAELRFQDMNLNAHCESMLTTHVTQLAVLDLPPHFDAFCFFHRASVVDSVEVLELAYGTLGCDTSAHVKWISNSTRLQSITLRDLVLVSPELLPALMASTTLTSLRLINVDCVNDESLRDALDHRPRKKQQWQLRELDLRGNRRLTPSSLYFLATSLRELHLKSFGIEILRESLDRPHARRLVDILWRQPTLTFVWLSNLTMAPSERIAVLDAIAERLPALEQFAFEPANDETDLDMTEALADAFLRVIENLKRIQTFCLVGWRWPQSRHAAFVRAVGRRHTLHCVTETVRIQHRFVEFTTEQREWLDETLSNHWLSRWSMCHHRLRHICCALSQLDWPAYVTLEVLDYIDPLDKAEHSRKIQAIILVKRAFRAKFRKV